MSQIEMEMKELEVSIEEAEKTVAMADTLRRLMKNPDWVTFIEQEYLREEAVRLTHLLGHPDANLDSKQKFIQGDLAGIAALKRFLHTTLLMGSIAADQIIAHKNELDELRAIEASGEYEDEGEE